MYADVDDATNGRERRANDLERDDARHDDRDVGVDRDDAMRTWRRIRWVARGMGDARRGDERARTWVGGGGDAEVFRAGAVCE